MSDQITRLIRCTQCGGEMQPEAGQIFLSCPFCESTMYVDKSKVVFHWYVNPTLKAEQASSSLFRWMSGNQTVKDLDQKSRLLSTEFMFFPLWHFRVRLQGNGETILLQPAAATSISELKNLKIPAGDLKKYDESINADAQPPTVPYETARKWLDFSKIQSEPQEAFLVHIPIYVFKYQYHDRIYTAIVEGGTGKVFANIFPSKSEAPYYLAGGLTALVYLGLALIPILALFFGNQAGGVALAISLGLAAVATPLLFLLGMWVASKI